MKTAPNHPAAGNEQLLRDTGRMPIWLRVPVALAGVFVLWLSAAIASSHLFGYDLGLHFRGAESGSPVLGFVGTLALGLFFMSVWFLRNRIFLDATHREILVRHSGLFRRSVRRVPLLDATGIYLRFGGTLSGTYWVIGIEFKNGRREWLTQIKRFEDADAAARTFSESTGLPVVIIREHTEAEIRAGLIFGTVITGLIVVASFYSHQPALFVWPVRLFCVICLVVLWYQALRELRTRRRAAKPQGSSSNGRVGGGPPSES
jgi:hypothetical protein